MFALASEDVSVCRKKWLIDIERQVSRLSGRVVEFCPIPSGAVRRCRRNPSVYFTHCTAIRFGIKLRVFQTGVGEKYLHPLLGIDLFEIRQSSNSYKVAIDERRGCLYVVYIKGFGTFDESIVIKKYDLCFKENASKMGQFRLLKLKIDHSAKRDYELVNFPDSFPVTDHCRLILSGALVNPKSGQLVLAFETMMLIDSRTLYEQAMLSLCFDDAKNTAIAQKAVMKVATCLSGGQCGNWDFVAGGFRLVSLYKPTTESAQYGPLVVLWYYWRISPTELGLYAAEEMNIKGAMKTALLNTVGESSKQTLSLYFDSWWDHTISYGAFGKYLVFGPWKHSKEMDKVLFVVRSTGRFTERQTKLLVLHIGSAVHDLLAMKKLLTDSHTILEQWLLQDGYLCVLVKARDKKTKQFSKYLLRLSLRKACPQQRRCFGCGKKASHGTKLQVCSVCKKKNLHRCWWKYACHFCSTDCLRSHWTRHNKAVHALPSLVLKEKQLQPYTTAIDSAYGHARETIPLRLDDDDDDDE